jgi:hypothetical protein|tara:strand:+ start:637 stop:759 length:123 start_codon:yes stop_codon:yes gene_type:complete
MRQKIKDLGFTLSGKEEKIWDEWIKRLVKYEKECESCEED